MSAQGSLAENARAELAAIAPERRCDRLAEASALFHTAGAVHLKGRGELAFHLDLAASAAARRAYALLSGLRVESQIRTYRARAFARPTRYQLHVDGSSHALSVLVEAGVVDRDHAPLERPPGHVVARRCCRGAYLRGAFLGGGSLSGPRSPHLEIRTSGHAGGSFLRSVAGVDGIRLQVSDRAGHTVAYAKGWEAIEGYLAAAGAAETVLGLEERAIVADLRGQANRLANADHANLVRQSHAAQQQLDAARKLKRDGTLRRLRGSLREAGELRLRHPEDSLRELAARAAPPASKAAMQRRLARLTELARE